jgi:hypothetical protein
MPVLAKLLSWEKMPTPVPYNVAVGILDRITSLWRAIGVTEDVSSYVSDMGISGYC